VVPSRKQFSRWINDHLTGLPHSEHCQVLEAMFPGHTARQLFAPDHTPGATTHTGAILEARPRREDHTTDRRDALRFGGALTAGYLLDSLHTEPDRLHATLNTSSTTPDHITHLEHTADELGVRVLKVAPLPLADEATSCFRTVRQLLGQQQRSADRTRLLRVAARLATVVGEILCDEGHVRLARSWYQAAHSAAVEAGDRLLADFALGGQALLPTYFGDPGNVLTLLNPRLTERTSPSPAASYLWASKARAHATLGQKIAFRHAINRARTMLDATPAEPDSSGIFSFRPQKLAFYEATGCARLGDAAGATESAERALALYESTDTIDPALARFDKATGLARAGETTEACRVATTAILDPHTYLAPCVTNRAREFDALLGEPRIPAVRDWRDVLTTTTRPDQST